MCALHYISFQRPDHCSSKRSRTVNGAVRCKGTCLHQWSRVNIRSCAAGTYSKGDFFWDTMYITSARRTLALLGESNVIRDYECIRKESRNACGNQHGIFIICVGKTENIFFPETKRKYASLFPASLGFSSHAIGHK